MAVKIFYSWQSDRTQNRNFIRNALDVAVKELRQDLTLDEPVRNIATDQDTQDIPGSPAVADTILTKIRSTDIFLADLTFITEDENRQTPNPNVMLEYGYALRSLGDAKIIGVFNDAYGSPQNLPFDLAHRRWPIRFKLASNTETATRDDEKKKLKDTLKAAIRSIIARFDETAPQQQQNVVPFAPAEPGDGIGRMRAAHDYLCLDDQAPVYLSTGPYAFLRLIPQAATQELGDAEAYKIAQAYLQPLSGMRSSRRPTGRHASGSISYWAFPEKPNIAWDAAQIFLSREIWANDFYHIIGMDRERSAKAGGPYIPTGALEEVLIDGLINFTYIAREHLNIMPPVQIISGLANVHGVKLAVDPNYFDHETFAGTILRDNFIWQASLPDWSTDPFDFLLPLFNKIYDSAGLTRPPVRTVGRRQR